MAISSLVTFLGPPRATDVVLVRTTASVRRRMPIPDEHLPNLLKLNIFCLLCVGAVAEGSLRRLGAWQGVSESLATDRLSPHSSGAIKSIDGQMAPIASESFP